MATPKNFRRFGEMIFAGGAPSPQEISELIKQYSLKYVLSLDLSSGQKISAILKEQKIHQIFIPIDASASHMTENVKYLIRNIRNILGNNQPIYVHCAQGQDRTGFALALYRVLKYNYSANQAINEAKRYNYGMGISKNVENFYNNILNQLAKTKNPSDVSAADDDFYYEGGFVVNENNLPYPNGSIRDIPMGYPYQESKLKQEDRLEILKSILEKQTNNDVNGIPQVGVYNSMGPIKGTGPVENSGILLNP